MSTYEFYEWNISFHVYLNLIELKNFLGNTKSFKSYIFMSFYLSLSVQFCQYWNWIDSFEKSLPWTEYSNKQGLAKIKLNRKV